MKIAFLEHKGFSNAIIRKLRDKFELFFLENGSIRDSLLEINPEVIFVRLSNYIDYKILDNTRVKYIISPTTGLNHIDLNYCELRNIKVISLKGEVGFLENIYSTAEHALLLTLSILRRTIKSSFLVNNNEWDRNQLVGNTINGKTVGIIGMGRLGSMYCKYMNALGAKCIYYDIDPHKRSEFGSPIGLEELLESSDIVSIHIPYLHNIQNYGFIGEKEFHKMRDGVFLINTSRGEVINEIDLIRNIKANKFSGVALDVVCDEINLFTDKWSENSKELFRLSKIQDYNILITPHLGGATIEDMQKTEEFIFNKFLNHAKLSF